MPKQWDHVSSIKARKRYPHPSLKIPFFFGDVWDKLVRLYYKIILWDEWIHYDVRRRLVAVMLR